MAVNFSDLPSTTTPINASNLNKIQSDLKSEVFEGTVRLTDCDDATEGGVYQYVDSTANLPSQLTPYGVILVLDGGPTSGQRFKTQLALSTQKTANYAYTAAIRTKLSNQSAWHDWIYFDEQASPIPLTAETGTLAQNLSYKDKNTVNVNIKFSGVNLSAGTTTVLTALPSKYYNTSAEASLCAYTGSKAVLNCWIRSSNGQLVVNSSTALNNQEIRIIGSYIL